MCCVTSEVYAFEEIEWNYDTSQYSDMPEYDTMSYGLMKGLVIKKFPEIDLTQYNYTIHCKGNDYYSAADIYLFQKDTVSLIKVGSSISSDGKIFYSHQLVTYYLDDDGEMKEVENQHMAIRYYWQFSNDPYLTIYKLGEYKNSYITEENMEYFELEQYCNQPIANSAENALLYLQTGDPTYLTNADDVVDVPMVNNFSIYEASEENNMYLYYENSSGFPDLSTNILDDGSKNTIIGYKYFYYDASGDAVDISDYEVVTLDYYRRNQYAISLEPISSYDTGMIAFYIYNYWSPGGKSDEIAGNYDPNKDSYGYWVLDPEGNKVGVSLENDAVIEKDALDFVTKNDSYTGADVSDEVDNNFLSGDFSFLGFIFSGFGLLGDNGLIALIGETFEFVPPEFIVLIGAGIVGVIILCFVKLLMK